MYSGRAVDNVRGIVYGSRKNVIHLSEYLLYGIKRDWLTFGTAHDLMV